MDNKDSIYDLTIDILHDRQNAVRGEIQRRFEKTKPFRTVPISNDELLVAYNQLNDDINAPLYMQTLIQRHGERAVSEMIAEFEQTIQRRGLNKSNQTTTDNGGTINGNVS